MKFLNRKVQNLPMSGGLYEVFQKTLVLENQGREIIHMEMGKPDFCSPQKAINASVKALEEGFVHYTSMTGIPELREAIANKEKRENNIIFDPNSEIMVTSGACEALMSIMMTMMNPGDEILIPSPFFPAYLDQAILCGVELIEVPLRFDNDFRVKSEDIQNKITDKTKILLINTPHNPTGAMLTKRDLEEIAELAIENNLLVISDETYDQFVFEGKHISISTLPNMKERTIVVNSASKIFSMTGWRIGYAIGPTDIIKYLNKAHQNMSTCATSFAQVGAAEAYNNSSDSIVEMVSEFKRRRDLIIRWLAKIEGVDFFIPKGAFYIFFSIQNLGITSQEYCDYILEEESVALVSGDSFGKYGEGFVRIAYACSYEDIEEAMKRIKRATEKLVLFKNK